MHVSSVLANAEQSSVGGIASLVIFLMIPLAMYFLLIRPQRRRQREQVAMQKAIEVGDEIMTTSGLYGFVTGFEGDIAWLEVDDNVQIRISRAAIQRKVDTSETAAASESTDDGRSTPIADDESK
jgi:preprotein translocase subunit YajC